MKKTEETKKNKPADEAVQAPYVPASVILFGNEHDPLTENEEAQAGKDEEKFHEDEEKPDDDEETFDDGGDDVFDPWKDDDEDEDEASPGRMGKTMTKIVTRLLAQGVVDGVFVPELVMIREKQP